MNIRQFQEADYESLSKWWVGVGEYVPPLPVLLDSKTYVVERDGSPIAIGTVFLGDNPWFAMAEDWIADPALDSETRRAAIHFLWDFVQNLLSALKYKRIFVFTRHERLAKRYQAAYGLEEVSSNVICLRKFI